MRPPVMTPQQVYLATMPLRPGHFRVLVTCGLGQVIGTALATVVGIVIPLMQIVGARNCRRPCRAWWAVPTSQA